MCEGSKRYHRERAKLDPNGPWGNLQPAPQILLNLKNMKVFQRTQFRGKRAVCAQWQNCHLMGIIHSIFVVGWVVGVDGAMDWMMSPWTRRLPAAESCPI